MGLINLRLLFFVEELMSLDYILHRMLIDRGAFVCKMKYSLHYFSQFKIDMKDYLQQTRIWRMASFDPHTPSLVSY